MTKYKNKTYSLRLPNELRLKAEYIATAEYRDFSKQYELMISEYVNKWESEHGQLIVGEDGIVSLAQPKVVKQGKSSNSKTG